MLAQFASVARRKFWKSVVRLPSAQKLEKFPNSKCWICSLMEDETSLSNIRWNILLSGDFNDKTTEKLKCYFCLCKWGKLLWDQRCFCYSQKTKVFFKKKQNKTKQQQHNKKHTISFGWNTDKILRVSFWCFCPSDKPERAERRTTVFLRFPFKLTMEVNGTPTFPSSAKIQNQIFVDKSWRLIRKLSFYKLLLFLVCSDSKQNNCFANVWRNILF